MQLELGGDNDRLVGLGDGAIRRGHRGRSAHGLAFDRDGTVDVTLSHRYAVELLGAGTGRPTPTVLSAAGGENSGTGGPWPDPVRIVAAELGSIIRGGAGNDTLVGSSRRDEIHGGAGNDTIDGGDNVDELRGGDGDDTVRGESRKRRALRRRRRRFALRRGEDDTLEAREPASGVADLVIDGGSDADSAFVDPDDPATIDVETRHCRRHRHRPTRARTTRSRVGST